MGPCSRAWPCGIQDRYAGDEQDGAVLAAASPDRSLRAGPGTMAQPDRVGVDELLRAPEFSGLVRF